MALRDPLVMQIARDSYPVRQGRCQSAFLGLLQQATGAHVPAVVGREPLGDCLSEQRCMRSKVHLEVRCNGRRGSCRWESVLDHAETTAEDAVVRPGK